MRPELLGVIGQEHLFKMLEAEGGEPKTFKYVKAQSEKGAVRRRSGLRSSQTRDDWC